MAERRSLDKVWCVYGNVYWEESELLGIWGTFEEALTFFKEKVKNNESYDVIKIYEHDLKTQGIRLVREWEVEDDE